MREKWFPNGESLSALHCVLQEPRLLFFFLPFNGLDNNALFSFLGFLSFDRATLDGNRTHSGR